MKAHGRVQSRFGREVRRRRMANNWTVDDLAAKVELTVDALSAIETGERDPALSVVQDIASVFGVSIGDLFGDSQGNRPDAREAASLLTGAPRDVSEAIITMLRAASTRQRRKR